jgi:hypothetical protein
MKVMADNVNGVSKVEEFEGVVLTGEEFYEALGSDSGECLIYAEIDDEMAEKIDAEYGIH